MDLLFNSDLAGHVIYELAQTLKTGCNAFGREKPTVYGFWRFICQQVQQVLFCEPTSIGLNSDSMHCDSSKLVSQSICRICLKA